jgi:hypothetical protein
MKKAEKIADIFNCISIVGLGICCRAIGNAEAYVMQNLLIKVLRCVYSVFFFFGGGEVCACL